MQQYAKSVGAQTFVTSARTGVGVPVRLLRSTSVSVPLWQGGEMTSSGSLYDLASLLESRSESVDVSQASRMGAVAQWHVGPKMPTPVYDRHVACEHRSCSNR